KADVAFKNKGAFKDKGVYVITGGLGGLGILFTREILREASDAKIILTGRSELSSQMLAVFDELQSLGGSVEYKIVDVSDLEAVNSLIEYIQDKYGKLDGIIHSAGVILDNFILKKSEKEFRKVLLPKVTGTVNLDKATRGIALDFFVLFSSGAGAMGNIGQADYATANAFMDRFAAYRNQLVSSKERKGQTLSINWPLWREGGMGVDTSSEAMMKQSTGMVAMQTEAGIQAFYQILNSNQSQTLVMEGLVSKIRETLFKEKVVAPTKTKQLPIPGIDPKLLHEKILQQIKGLFGQVIKLVASKIDENEVLESYGIDSIMITQLNQKLEEVFGEISKTLFFEYQTLEALTEYFTKEYMVECLRWTGLYEEKQETAKQETKSLGVTSWPELKSFKAQKTNHRNNPISFASNQSEPIAIIGISGIYPHAENLEEYWGNLKNGKSCITEIPSDRWNWKDYYRPKSEQTGIISKPYSKWGGFLKHWNQFDPLFFNITPKDAENIDPQERLFLQESWKALEDAGYCPSSFSREMRKNIAVFAGITKQGFNLYFDPKETY
ncbi:MAG: SDR family NAD(P)-dependent oxidoreductase, partial [Planctomycetes bacterium]|nr:SDR family NAD(P)-dependent oxidoreductase [Planctomycetota bacterium]